MKTFLIFSANSIYKYIKQQHYNCSVNTITKYIDYLKEAYIVDEIPQYSSKLKRELAYYGKLYNANVAFNSLRATGNVYDLNHNLENVIYNELLYMGYDVKVFNVKNKEIDFMCTKDNKLYYVQVAYSVSNQKTFDREIEAFNLLDNQHQKILITKDNFDYSSSTVKHIKLKDFLFLDSLDK